MRIFLPCFAEHLGLRIGTAAWRSELSSKIHVAKFELTLQNYSDHARGAAACARPRQTPPAVVGDSVRSCGTRFVATSRIWQVQVSQSDAPINSTEHDSNRPQPCAGVRKARKPIRAPIRGHRNTGEPLDNFFCEPRHLTSDPAPWSSLPRIPAARDPGPDGSPIACVFGSVPPYAQRPPCPSYFRTKLSRAVARGVRSDTRASKKWHPHDLRLA